MQALEAENAELKRRECQRDARLEALELRNARLEASVRALLAMAGSGSVLYKRVLQSVWSRPCGLAYRSLSCWWVRTRSSGIPPFCRELRLAAASSPVARARGDAGGRAAARRPLGNYQRLRDTKHTQRERERPRRRLW